MLAGSHRNAWPDETGTGGRTNRNTHGTLNVTNIHPREVVKRALAVNAAAVIFVHNHPSGEPEPSEADKKITVQLREALNLIDVRVLDHIVVGAKACISMAERGLV